MIVILPLIAFGISLHSDRGGVNEALADKELPITCHVFEPKEYHMLCVKFVFPLEIVNDLLFPIVVPLLALTVLDP